MDAESGWRSDGLECAEQIIELSQVMNIGNEQFSQSNIRLLHCLTRCWANV